MLNLGNLLDRAVSFGTGIIGRWKLYAAIAGAVALALTVAYCTGRSDGKDAERAAQAKAEAIALEKARKADVEAGQVVDEVKAGVAAENERARDAAKDSDDPLKSAMDAL